MIMFHFRLAFLCIALSSIISCAPGLTQAWSDDRAAAEQVDRYLVRGSSMFPLLQEGDVVVVEPKDPAQIKYGDVIVLRAAANGGAPLIKIVVGTPGQSLVVGLDGELLIDGRRIPRLYGKVLTVPSERRRFVRQYTGELPGFWVAGTRNSMDSMVFGPVPTENVIGVVTGLQEDDEAE